jgi:uncharacterized protein (TIGR02453 family)
MKDVLEFLDGLEQNNDRAWFHEHRAEYDRARQQFRAFVEKLIAEVHKFEPLEDLRVEDCLFRLHRDVRFSNDKRPYKTHLGAAIAPGGRKTQLPVYYVHLAPHNGSLVAGGIYAPTGEILSELRRAIAEDPAPFRAVVSNKTFKKQFGGLSGDQLKTAPQGYAKDHPEIDLLRYKQWIVHRTLTDEEVLSKSLVSKVMKSFQAMQPMNDLLTRKLASLKLT